MNDAFSARAPLLSLLVLALFGAARPAALPGASGANDEYCVTETTVDHGLRQVNQREIRGQVAEIARFFKVTR